MDRKAKERPLVFVSVGTDHHRFDRLLATIAKWAQSHPEVAVLAQTGHTPPPEGLDAVAFMDRADLGATFARATAVVCHGGPSTIMEARAAGHVPIVVARDPDRGEHVDGHQMRFVSQISGQGIIAAVQEPDEISDAVSRAVEAGPSADIGVPRAEAEASIDRIGNLLDGLIARRRRARTGRAS